MRSFQFSIDYTINDVKRYNIFLKLFEKIKQEKSIYQANSQYDFIRNTDWTTYLDKQAKEWYSDVFDYESEEGKTYLKLWQLTSPSIRVDHPMFKVCGNWDLDATLDAIFKGDYTLEKIEFVENQGKLFYSPNGAPFGGTESLVQLIESFGNVVTYDAWHEGPHLREKVGWDYERAKELIKAGKPLNKYLDLTPRPQKENQKMLKKKWWHFFFE